MKGRYLPFLHLSVPRQNQSMDWNPTIRLVLDITLQNQRGPSLFGPNLYQMGVTKEFPEWTKRVGDSCCSPLISSVWSSKRWCRSSKACVTTTATKAAQTIVAMDDARSLIFLNSTQSQLCWCIKLWNKLEDRKQIAWLDQLRVADQCALNLEQWCGR